MGGHELILIILVFAYFIPAVVAVSRHYHNAAAIFILNLLLGWTVLGWIIALVWASTAVRREPEPVEAPRHVSPLNE